MISTQSELFSAYYSLYAIVQHQGGDMDQGAVSDQDHAGSQ